MKFAGVIVDISHEQLDKIFQYIIPETMLPELEIGMKVQIPFGKTRRTGYVVDISDEPEIDISRNEIPYRDLRTQCNNRRKDDKTCQLDKKSLWFHNESGT